MATSLTITRDKGYANVLRDYLVILDDKEIGRIANRKSQTSSIPPGGHTLRLKIDWCCSNTVELHIPTNGHLQYQCGSSLRGVKLLFGIFYILFAPNKYLWLQATNEIQR